MRRGLLAGGIAAGVLIEGLCAATFANTVPSSEPATQPTTDTVQPEEAFPGPHWLNEGLHDLDRTLAKIDSRITPKAFSQALYWENDGAYTKVYDPTDRHYTSGTGFSIQWQSNLTNDIVDVIPSINNEFSIEHPKVTYASGIIGALRMYTPRDLDNPNPMYDDRPYAGWAYAGVMLQRADRAGDVPTMEHFELDAGTLGPRSQAGYIQAAVHGFFHEEEPMGWENQVGNEYGGDLKYQRRWRMDLAKGDDSSPTLQLLPYVDGTVGTVHMNASAGAVLRYGVNLPDDFGPARLDWPADFTSPMAGSGRRDSGIYVFVRPAGRAVFHDATLGESYFHGNPVEVEPEPFVFEIQAGITAHISNHVKVTYSQTFDSLEFRDQQQWDSYGSLIISGEWVW